MTTQAQLRNRYARETVTTASPAQLVTMLYDRLLKDLATAETAIAARDIQSSHNALLHAQDIITELHATLDTDAWKEGEQLKRLYEWCLDELMAANLGKDPRRIANARTVLEPLAATWHQVAKGA